MRISRFFLVIGLGMGLVGLVFFGLHTRAVAETAPSFPQSPESPQASAWYVTETGNDLNTCTTWISACATIAEAVVKAVDGDTIYIESGTYQEHDILVTEDLTITGVGLDKAVIDANDLGRIFQTGGTILISHVRLEHGLTSPGINWAGNGGAVYNSTLSHLTLQDVEIVDNNAVGGGGGIFNMGYVTLVNSQVLSNTAASSGGGLYGIYGSVITVTQSTIAHNTSEGAASGGGGIHDFGASLFVEDSEIVDNSAVYFGGGLFIADDQAVLSRTTLSGNQASQGAGFYANQGMITATNTTVSGNTGANNYGGIFLSGATAHLYLQNSTIADNDRVATGGLGLNGVSAASGSTVTMVNTLLAYNEERNCNASTPPTSLGHNLSSDLTCVLTQAGDLQGVNPLIAPLADYGGFVETHALLPASPAIDAGDDARCPGMDARNIPRPYDGDGNGILACDIGAVEARHQLSITDCTVDEGDSGSTPAVFTVTLAPTSTMTVSVDYVTVAGSATADEDYTAVTGTLNFNPGTAVMTISVPVLGDLSDEPDEMFGVVLSQALNADLLDGQGTGTIVDDDGLPTLSIGDRTATEGNTGSASMVFSVTLSPASTSVVSVSYALVDGTAVQGSDYTGSDGELVFQPGDVEKGIPVSVLGDVIDEGTKETFSVSLSNPVSATLLDGDATGTITDDDYAHLRHALGPQVVEGNSGMTPATFTVTLSTPAVFTVTVDYAVSSGFGESGAIAGEDFEPISGTLTFAPGELLKNYVVQIYGDTDWELDEQFSSLLSNGVVPISPNATSGTILNDDDYFLYTPLVLR